MSYLYKTKAGRWQIDKYVKHIETGNSKADLLKASKIERILTGKGYKNVKIGKAEDISQKQKGRDIYYRPESGNQFRKIPPGFQKYKFKIAASSVLGDPRPKPGTYHKGTLYKTEDIGNIGGFSVYKTIKLDRR
jgi:hypothetical protein